MHCRSVRVVMGRPTIHCAVCIIIIISDLINKAGTLRSLEADR